MSGDYRYLIHPPVMHAAEEFLDVVHIVASSIGGQITIKYSTKNCSHLVYDDIIIGFCYYCYDSTALRQPFSSLYVVARCLGISKERNRTPQINANPKEIHNGLSCSKSHLPPNIS
jgi:hypothetical protein